MCKRVSPAREVWQNKHGFVRPRNRPEVHHAFMEVRRADAMTAFGTLEAILRYAIKSASNSGSLVGAQCRIRAAKVGRGLTKAIPFKVSASPSAAREYRRKGH